MSKKNKSLIAILLVLCVGLVGVTIAYFSSTTTFENEFQTKEYGTTYTESFVSPDNWLPGDTTNKTVIVTNSGTVDEAVRISLSETWTPNNSNATLNGWIHADGTKSNHTTENELSTDVRAAIINFTNNSDWTKVGDYYYYNYRLAPGQTTDSLIESVTFNALTKLGDTCVTSSENGIKTITCNSSGEDYDHATYKLTVNIETVQYNKYQEAWNTQFAIAEEKPAPVVQQTGAEYLASSATNAVDAEYNDSTKGNMFTFSHTVNGKTVNESRYIGDAPNNYVYFNCDEPQEGVEYNYANSCEVWRIIGTFDVERTDPTDSTKTITETRMKLVRGDILESRVFNSNENNDWTVAPLNTYLNTEYYDGTATNGLKQSARDMIESAKYYLSAVKVENSTIGFGSAEQIYIKERGNTICGSCNSNSDKLMWEGNVGLLYPSDLYMTYKKVDETCYVNPNDCNQNNAGVPTTGWIYNTNILGNSNPTLIWLLSPYFVTISYASGKLSGVLNTYSNGYLGYNDSYSSSGVRPVVYLKSSINIISGEGTELNPYILGL